MAAVAPQKVQCEFGSYYPAGMLVKAATSPSHRDIAHKRCECESAENEVENERIYIQQLE